MNAAALAALDRLEPVHYVGPIDPPVLLREKALSKLMRVVGGRGDFAAFSQLRLKAIAEEVACKCNIYGTLDFFHGFTPWILTAPKRPYIAWSDCTFRDYIDIYHSREQFGHTDLQRIELAEAAWLQAAQRVFFTSEWAASRAIQHYRINEERVGVVGIFGELDAPVQDAYRGGKYFVLISTDFAGKGGPVALAALREVKKRHADASLVVIGDKPRRGAATSGVEFVGYLRKENPVEHARFRNILGGARALVHPTKRDIAPLVLIEAGYCGCPVIASRRFAIPEVVDDRITGLLVDDPCQVDQVASSMTWMLEQEDQYQRMREAAWHRARRQSKQLFEERLRILVREVLSGNKAEAL